MRFGGKENNVARKGPQSIYMLDTKVYKHKLRICNITVFSTASVVARTRLNITLHVHCLPGLLCLLPLLLKLHLTRPAGTGAIRWRIVNGNRRPLYIQKRNGGDVGLGASLGGSGKSGTHRC